MKSKKPDVHAYVDFLLQSELGHGIKKEYLYREPLARAIIEVLKSKGIITGDDVLRQFYDLMDEELTFFIDKENLEENPHLIPLKLDFSK